MAESTASLGSILAAARALGADAVTAEAADAFAAAGIESIVLRGPSVARHLYRADERRAYGDADLLVRRDCTGNAGDVLRELGFRDVTGLGRAPNDRPAWSSTWARERDGGTVDLHWTVVGAQAPPEAVWVALAAHAEPLQVARRGLVGLNASATALIIALHAAQHGITASHVGDDLTRALALVPRETWEQATQLAERIDAAAAYGFGLRLLPAGADLADSLGLLRPPSVETILRAENAPATALGFDWLSQTPGLGSKARFVAGKVAPDRTFVRVWFPPARRGGSLTLVLGYVWRPLWLLWHAPGGVRAWSAARRAARDQRPS
jgi:Uncharacterised nucleotidyltransferase